MLCLLFPAVLPADDWPQWRGPGRDGQVAGFPDLTAWPETLTRRWSVEAGDGSSSPIVAGSSVFLFAHRGDDEVVRAFDMETGAARWETAYPAPLKTKPILMRPGLGPHSTPAAGASWLMTFGSSGLVSCLDRQSGRLLWQRSFEAEFPQSWPPYGIAQSPLIDGRFGIVHVGGHVDGVLKNYDPATDRGDYTPGAGAGALRAFDLTSGEVRWSWGGDGPGYASPVLAKLQGSRQVVTLSQRACEGIDAATGKLLWSFPFDTTIDQNIVTPLVVGDRVVISGNRSGIASLQPLCDGTEWKVKEVWRNREFSLYMSSPVVSGTRLLAQAQERKGTLCCLDLVSGRTLWATEGRFSEHASLLVAGKWLLVQTAEGELIAAPADAPAFAPVRRYRVAEGTVWAHPAISGDRILIRDARKLTLWSIRP
jgi:outer membrane protein assembly factor BamB